jgi:uncharacterized protein (DUF488 family)
MFNREKLLLWAVREVQRRGLDKLYLMKLFFLIRNEIKPTFAFYGFFPHKFGAYSSRIQHDLDFFVERGYLKFIPGSKHEYSLTEEGVEHAEAPPRLAQQVEGLFSRHPSTNEMIEYTYSTFPWYASRSQRPGAPLVAEEIPACGIYLIGYEKRQIDDFLATMIRYKIDIVVDVRKNPRSMNFEYNTAYLEKSLKRIRVEYRVAPQLGIPTGYREDLSTTQQREELFAWYRESILSGEERTLQALSAEAQTHRIALLCFERDHRECHRGVIGEELHRRGALVTPVI